jgi:hypothetical protein
MVAAACVAALLFTVRHARAQGIQPAVAGRVVQGTAGARLPERLQIVLLAIDSAAGQIVERATADMDAEGRFAFGSERAGQGVSHRLFANTGDGLYSQELELSNVADRSNIELKIWETTTALDSISVTSYVMLAPTIDDRTRLMGVLAVAGIRNSGDKVWQIDPARPGLTGLDLVRFNLPEGYRDLSVESDLPAGNTLEIGTGFAITNPIPPGSYSILMSYAVPYTGDSLDFELKLPFGAGLVRVMLPENRGRLAGTGADPSGSVVLNDTVYQALEGRGYDRGASVKIRFAGLPQPSLTGKIVDFFEGRVYALVIIWVAAAVMIGLLAYAFIASRRRARATPALAGGTAGAMAGGTAGAMAGATAGAMAVAGGGDIPASEPAEETLSERQRLVAEIAALDDLHTAGKVGDAEHTAKRAELKERALRLGRETGDARPGAG